MGTTKLRTFSDLSERDQLSIRWVIDALNSIEGADTLAAGSQFRVSVPATLLHAIEADAKEAEKLYRQWRQDELDLARVCLTAIARRRPLPHADDLAGMFEAHVRCEPTATVKRGRVVIDAPLRFTDPLGMIAYAVLRLAELNSPREVLLCCDECKKFRLIEQRHVGRRSSRFCSTRCRNKFNSRKHRHRESAKHK